MKNVISNSAVGFSKFGLDHVMVLVAGYARGLMTFGQS
jgi:hypothetical protein